MSKTPNIDSLHWQLSPFNQLSSEQLYSLIKRRIDIFVVEQQCAYAELDNKDLHPQTLHLLAYEPAKPPAEQAEPVAYARLLAPGVSYDSASIGRILVAHNYRGSQLSQQLLNRAITHCRQQWPTNAITIGAQAALQRFYQDFGFEPTSSIYDEDGIDHIDMSYRPDELATTRSPSPKEI